ADAALVGAIKERPGLRLPGTWDRFELAVRAILGQQVSVKGATTLAGRIARSFGEPSVSVPRLTHIFPTADVLAKADLRWVGLTNLLAEIIRALAKAVARTYLRFYVVVDSEEFVYRLRQLPGIGGWTAQYIAMRALGDPDAFPSGDIALMRNLRVNTAQALQERAESWRPWRAYAAIYIWSMAAAKPRGFW